jgi:hypothetical protein
LQGINAFSLQVIPRQHSPDNRGGGTLSMFDSERERRDREEESRRRQASYERVDHNQDRRDAPRGPRSPEDVLPAEARETFERLKLHRAEAVGVARELADRANELRTAIARQEIECRRLVAPNTKLFATGAGENFAETSLSVVNARARLDRFKGELQTISQRHTPALARFEAVGQLVHRIEEFLDGCRGARFICKVVAIPANISSHQALDLIEQKRRRSRELKSDIAKVEAAPWPSAAAKHHMRSYVDALVAKGRPDCSPVVDQRGGNIQWPIVFPRHDPERILGLMAWSVRSE